MSKTVCTYPIVAAIKKADDIIGKNRTWKPTGNRAKAAIAAQQKRYLQSFHAAQLSEIAKIPEIESIASFSADEINAWLAAHKFQIELDPFEGPHNFGTASVLDVTVHWLEAGKKAPVTLAADQTKVPGVFLKSGVSFSYSKKLGVVVNIRTKSDDIVHMALANTDVECLDLMDLITEHKPETPIFDYEGVHFPMVDLDDRPDIAWLQGLRTVGADGEGYEIAQALQQIKLRVNEKGARAKSAVAIAVMLSTSVHMPKPPFIINGPFLFWIERPGLSKPFLVAHLTEESFKESGSLEEL